MYSRQEISLLRSYGVTITRNLVGTSVSLDLSATFAYAISRKSFKYRNFFGFLSFLHDAIQWWSSSDLYR